MKQCVSLYWNSIYTDEQLSFYTYSFVPVELLLRELVGAGMVEKSLLKLGVNGVELLKSGLLSHLC
jgi:hypothetical protein